MAARKAPVAATPEAKVRDLKSEAWRDLFASPNALGPLLAGVTWHQPRAYEPGALLPNALFAGRGASHAPLARRLLAVVCAASPSPAVDALRATITGLTVSSDEPLDLSQLAALRSLRWLVIKGPSITGLAAIAHVPKLELRVGEVDLAALSGMDLAELMVSPIGWEDDTPRPRIRGAASLCARAVRLIRTTFEDELRVGATELSILYDAPELGPISGPARSLELYNDARLTRVTLGELPRLETLRTMGVPVLSEIVGAERCETLREVVLRAGMSAIPKLPDSVESLTVEGKDLDLSSLRDTLPRLRTLRVSGALRGVEAIGSCVGLESLAFEPQGDLGALDDILAKLPKLRYLSLAGHSLERVPSALRHCRDLETVSLIGCSGFMEHDVLSNLPALRELRLARSTLAAFKKQLDPRLKKRGVTIDWDTQI